MTAEAALGLLGLGARAGTVVVGVAGVRAALRRGGVELVVVAADRSARTVEKVERLAAARGVPVVTGPPASDLGVRLGRPPLQAVGVLSAALARGIREAVSARRV